MSTFSTVFARQIRELEAAKATWREEAGRAALEAIREEWPSQKFGGDVHRYATDTSLKAWRQIDHEGAFITIICPVAYSGYTELGYTRKGPETARSWGIRAYGPYSLTALAAAPIRDITDRLIREALNG